MSTAITAITESSERQDWRTPESVLDPVRAFFGGQIGLDPCGGEGSIVGAKTEFRGLGLSGETHSEWDYDGLAEEWTDRGPVFVNPPYGREIGHWVAKCGTEFVRGAEIVLLVPARVGTGWWRKHVLGSAQAVCFWAGRIKFRHPVPGTPACGATFDSALIYLGPRSAEFCAAFADHGWCVRRSSRVRMHVEKGPDVSVEWRG